MSESESKSFVARALAGEWLDPNEAIDDAIDRWHASSTDRTIYEWLGLSKDEYAIFVERPDHLRTILKARRYGLSLDALLDATGSAETDLAARGLSRAELDDLLSWLKKTRRI